MNNQLLGFLLIGYGVIKMIEKFKIMGKAGRELIKYFEGYSDVPYKDQAGIPTIGWGHKILSTESFDKITKEEAETLLGNDLSNAQFAVNNYVTVPLNDNQFDALVSFAYNVGNTAFKNSTLLRKLNLGDYSSVTKQLKRWKYITVDGEKIVSNGLINRRNHEAALFSV